MPSTDVATGYCLYKEAGAGIAPPTVTKPTLKPTKKTPKPTHGSRSPPDSFGPAEDGVSSIDCVTKCLTFELRHHFNYSSINWILP